MFKSLAPLARLHFWEKHNKFLTWKSGGVMSPGSDGSFIRGRRVGFNRWAWKMIFRRVRRVSESSLLWFPLAALNLFGVSSEW